MAKAQLETKVETGLSSRLQPWQALFGLLSYAVGVYGISDEKALVLYGMIIICLGFTQDSTYKHKQAVKEIVAPWLVEQLLNTLSEYLGTPVPPSETEGVPISEDTEQVKTQLKAQIAMLEGAIKNGTSDSG